MLTTKVREASFVVTISEFNRDFIREHAPAATPVHIVHCGVDPDAYGFRPRRVPRAGPVKALCVASLQEKKGHAVLLEALAGGGPTLARLSIDLVGGGELRSSLEAQVRRLGLDDRVSFLGPRSEEEVRALLAQADLFVLPSIVASDGQMEGLPVALIEALASGLPTIATRLSGIPELICDGETGLLAEPADPGSLAEALTRALAGASPNPRHGRELIERAFDVRESASRMSSLFGTGDSSSP